MNAAKEKIFRLNKERLRIYIRGHKMRSTMERETILRRMCELKSPFTVEEVIQAVQSDFISLPTVYNAIALLQKAEIIHLLGKQYSQRNAQYEITSGNMSHLQVVCTRCGRVTEFQDTAISNIMKNRSYNNFIMRHFSLYAYGECKFCRKKINIQKNI